MQKLKDIALFLLITVVSASLITVGISNYHKSETNKVFEELCADAEGIPYKALLRDPICLDKKAVKKIIVIVEPVTEE